MIDSTAKGFTNEEGNSGKCAVLRISESMITVLCPENRWKPMQQDAEVFIVSRSAERSLAFSNDQFSIECCHVFE